MTDPGSGTPMSERMQALLSRAVEDQLSEQRQVANAMTEVRNHLAHLGAELQQLRATAGGAADEEIQRQVAGVAADVREAIRVLSERLDGVAGLVQQRGNDLTELRGLMGELRGVIDNELRPRVDGVDAAMRDLRGAFTGIGSRVADLPGRQEIETMLARTTEASGPVDERLEQMQGWIEEVHDGLFGETGVHPRVQALVEQAAEAPETSDEDLGARIDEAVRSAVSASEKRITAHVDEAVLALAEALLRKRSRTGTLGLSAFDTGEIPIVPPAAQASEPEPDEPAGYEPEEPAASHDHLSGAAHFAGAAEPAAPVPPSAPASSQVEEESFSPPAHDGGLPTTSLPSSPPAQIDLDPEPASAPTAYQPATGPLGDGHDDYGDDDDAARRRRPWWRPGD